LEYTSRSNPKTIIDSKNGKSSKQRSKNRLGSGGPKAKIETIMEEDDA